MIDLKMPDLSTTEEDITVVQWMVKVGQPIRQGQPIIEVQTDKATMEVESFVTGILAEVLVGPQDKVEVGQVIARVQAASAAGVAAGSAPQASAPAATAAEPAAPLPQASPAAPSPEGAAPRQAAKGMFARNRQRLAQPDQSLRPQAPAAAVPPAVVPAAGGADAAKASVSLSPVQRTVGRRMLQSKLTAPHFYLLTSFNAAAILARRDAARPEKVAWDAFIVHAAAKAIQRFPKMAARFENGHLLPAATDAIGVAVDLDGDLFVVPVAEAAQRSVLHISRQIRQDVERLRSGDAGVRQLHPGVMTITNLVAANVEAFIPIINPPESAILAVGKVAAAVVAVNGTIAVQQRAQLTLAVDHRVVNGRYAGEFLGAIVQELEAM